MVRQPRYYVHRHEGKVTRLAKIQSDGAYGWVDNQWVSMPGLHKIEWEITDYDDITEEEARKIIGTIK